MRIWFANSSKAMFESRLWEQPSPWRCASSQTFRIIRCDSIFCVDVSQHEVALKDTKATSSSTWCMFGSIALPNIQKACEPIHEHRLNRQQRDAFHMLCCLIGAKRIGVAIQKYMTNSLSWGGWQGVYTRKLSDSYHIFHPEHLFN